MSSPVVVPAPPALSAVRSSQPWYGKLLQFASAYLPLLLMVALAVGTWWLVSKTPLDADMLTAAPPRHEPDYEMRNFEVQRFAPQGTLRAQIQGEAMRHYPDTDTLEIDNVRLRAITPDGRITLATARRAIANGAGTEVQLLGSAEVVREASLNDEAIRFRSEFLHAFLEAEQVRSHLPVAIIKGGMEVRVDGMQYSHLDRVMHFNGRLNGTWIPKATR